MASSSTMPKQLRELLQQQQEPFILEFYLLEKGFSRNNLNSEAGLISEFGFRCCSSDSRSILKKKKKKKKRLAIWGLNNRRKVIPSCSKIVKSVFNRSFFVFDTKNQKMKNPASVDRNSSVRELGGSNREAAEPDGFSSTSDTTAFHSCSGTDIEDEPSSSQNESSLATADSCPSQEKEANTDRKLKWRSREGNKELSPLSVLEEMPSIEDSPVHDNRHRNAKTRNFILAVPFYKFPVQSSMDEPPPSSQYLTANRVLQQSKQLLFDWVKELVETRAWKDGTRRQLLEFLGPEELGKLLCEDQRTWSKLSRNKTNTAEMLHSVAEWSDFEPEMREIGGEIGDFILEDISQEIVADMMSLLNQIHGQLLRNV
ncbi:hypothetical protein U1Q18_005450 [Sarracenia purpurea var. burkii]